MKTWYSFIVALLLSGKLLAQGGAPEQECFNALPICQSVYTQPNSYTGNGTTQELNNTNAGCLSSNERNDVWYVINVSTSGTLAFNITPNNLTNDYDFAVWNVTGLGCQAIYNGTLPVGCNYSATPGATGLSNTITGGAYGPALNVTAGQTYILNISNYTGSQSGYTLDFSPSTATIFDNLPPHFAGTASTCGYVADSIEVIMSEPVKCSSLTPTGSDFSLSPLPAGISIVSATGLTCQSANSATIRFRIKFSGTLPAGTYVLSAKEGTDGNTLLDNCGNAQVLGDTVSFTMNAAIGPYVIKVDTPACISARIALNRKVMCNTVAADGSDFTVTGSSPVQVISAQALSCDASGMTDTLLIAFNGSVATAGTYILGFKNGTDGNGIADVCGLPITETFPFPVSDAGVNVTATPPVLCAPGYTQLLATTAFPPSGSKFFCGLHAGPIAGTVNTFQAGTATTATNGTTTYTPFNGSYWNARTQILYNAADLKAAGMVGGPITALAFNILQKQSTVPYSNFTIKMGCTALADLSGGYVAGLPVVYGPVSFNAQPGTNNITLTTPYDWDSTQNLLVEICFNNTTASNYDQVAATTGTNTTNSVYSRYQNSNVAGCAFTNTTGTGGNSSARPNITFQQVVPPPPSYGWLWSPSQFVGDSTNPSTQAYVPKTQEYTIRLRDSFQCFRRGRVTVIVSERNPVAGPNNDTALCAGGAAELMVSGGVRYEWFPATGLSCTDCPNPTATPTQTTTYYAAIFDQYGCSDTLKNVVVVNPLPIVYAGRDTAVYYGSTVPLHLLAPGGRSILWRPVEGLSNFQAPNPIAGPLETTTYTVLVIDTNGCSASDSVRVTVDRTETLLVPSAFTPNGDRNNDIFRVINLTFQKLIEMRIYDRWGNLVHATTDNAKGWDGTYGGDGGQPAPSGVYQYLIRVSHPDGVLQTFKGDVTLIR